ncbi:hypothetical protein [Kitasatospora sp. NBC_01250]|uniref:hypothetical protein n=1 Tax=Kitasatospora sp. NBC_01250 TaxID=2903571 RepID=UPI002E335F36|nr:hypothetical protein [Kitasatospora sp. NBC_01250]
MHSTQDHNGFIPALISLTRSKGVAAYVGDGANRWPAVHTLDAAHLYRLALESAPAGSRLHGVDDQGIPFREIAEAIGRRLYLPVVSTPSTQADAHFGFLSAHATADNPSSNALTRNLLGWKPVQPGLIDDLGQGHYFDVPATRTSRARPQLHPARSPRHIPALLSWSPSHLGLLEDLRATTSPHRRSAPPVS